MKVLEVNNLSKKYRLGVMGSNTLYEDIKKIFKKKKTLNEGSERVDEAGDFWALKNIGFSVQQGEVLGIIGHNGAGKSTLLKILSQITAPTTGEIKIKGRVASLLEVGTGFHPELSGRENIFLNGAILGMARVEIKKSFDEIIVFSGIEHHLDTPVKHYSSGMKVRLGFAVAAHLQPEILIIDEVLAVGDAEFQKKCLGKMQDVANDGRTVLFVSHNMTAVRSLCPKALLLKGGKLEYIGSSDEAIGAYLGRKLNQVNSISWDDSKAPGIDTFLINKIEVIPGDQNNTLIYMDKPFNIKMEIKRTLTIDRYDITFQFKGPSGTFLFVLGTGIIENHNPDSGLYHYNLEFPGNFFNSGTFDVNMLIVKNKAEVVFQREDIFSFSVLHEVREEGSWMGRSKGDLAPKFDWNIQKISGI